ncbi:DEAD box RNA helicase (PRH75) [Artemisia annua]|uniref:DEAD box RNA helicase (PRH75) n=1 Tax=Artemisia annua TaxID=35608 RepID=A0A2U1NJE3_ARTAN|nr:DEAD box RNA helicase (PRH75) [Artemisia annua]
MSLVLNLIVEDLFQGHPICKRKLKELLGHTPSQVVAGDVLGILCTLFFSLLTAINFSPLYCEPLLEIEDYIYRSGRTERAGNYGVAITLYEPQKANISRLEREVGVKFEHASAPQPLDIAIAGLDAAEAIQVVSDSPEVSVAGRSVKDIY